MTETSERIRIERYEPTTIEPRWQARWAELELYRTDLHDTSRPKFYLLTMYPYPSGDLHIGHWYIITPTDAVARFHRMHGQNVFLPIGFDAFGLPAENAAIARGVNPRDWTMHNIQNMRRQLRSMGATLDWDSEVVTCEPEFYRWNQWLFLQFLEAGLAYRAKATVDWCPNDGTLAREQVEGADRHCWRCGALVEKRDLEQWFLKVTNYTDELLDFGGIDWPEPIKVQQTNWIGRSEGAEIVFTTATDDHQPGGDDLRVFTTRPDTLHGATFMVLAPEHALVERLTHPDRRDEVAAYVIRAGRETEIERLSTDREKTGVPLGADAINPVNGERIPIWIADYVLAGYGTGAIMAVPAHDERDFAFARRFGLPIRRVVAPPETADGEAEAVLDDAYVAHAAGERLVNSDRFSGLPADEGGRAIVEWLASEGKARPTVTYRLRDWLISRQRYWGTPIPVIHCEQCGIVPVPDEDLPVLLPDTVDYRGHGVNPLSRDEAFLRVTCPRCDGPARRETDTMDTFVDSSWYWYRYLSPHKDEGPIDPAMVARWDPVDQYTGGSEHAVMHLLYAREFTKMMRDVGLIAESEPFRRLFNQGQILGADGERMSKSRGNVEDPDDLVRRYGADTVRLFLMFMGPWDQGGPWSPSGIGGVHRFLNRVWSLVLDPHGTESGDPGSGTLRAGEDAAAARATVRQAAHRTLAGVTRDHEGFRFNTMVAKLMELANLLQRYRGSVVAGSAEWDETIRLLLLMLAPSAPHIAEELWSRRLAAAGTPWSSIHEEPWPEADPTAIVEATREVPIQVNGKLRDRVEVPASTAESELEAVVLARPKVQAALAGRTPDRIIHAGGGRLVNIVVR
ncbi:MAG TPA: leucine--tRNA ligase [Candidatus Limnocylindrales bacterium]